MMAPPFFLDFLVSKKKGIAKESSAIKEAHTAEMDAIFAGISPKFPLIKDSAETINIATKIKGVIFLLISSDGLSENDLSKKPEINLVSTTAPHSFALYSIPAGISELVSPTKESLDFSLDIISKLPETLAI